MTCPKWPGPLALRALHPPAGSALLRGGGERDRGGGAGPAVPLARLGNRGARVRMRSGCSGPQLGPGVQSPRPSQPLRIPPTGASLRAGARPGLAGGFGGAHA